MIPAKHTHKEHILELLPLIYIPSFLTVLHIVKIVSQSWQILLPAVCITTFTKQSMRSGRMILSHCCVSRLRRKLFPLLSRGDNSDGEKPHLTDSEESCLPLKEYKFIWYTNTNSLQLWDLSSRSSHIYVRNIDLSSLLRIDGQIIVDSLAVCHWFEYWQYILYLCACLFTVNSQPTQVLTRCSWNNS